MTKTNRQSTLTLIAVVGLTSVSPVGAQQASTSVPAHHGVKKSAAKPASKPAAAPVTITIRANSDVSGKSFTLAEIADVTGGDRALAKRIGELEIGVSPLPGVARLLLPGDVTVRLRAGKVELKQLIIIAPPAIRVTRIGTEVSSDQIVKEALESAKDAIRRMPDAVLEPVPSPIRITVPSGKMLVLAGAWRGQPDLGLIYVPVSLVVDGKTAQTIDVAIRVRRKSRAFVTTRIIEPREVLTANDVTLAPTDLPASMGAPITNIDEIVGKRAVRRMSANTPVIATSLETPPAVATNDRVTIEYVFGTVHISAPGVARQSGAVGDSIRVYAPDTKKEVDATIVDAHTVRITDDNEQTRP